MYHLRVPDLLKWVLVACHGLGGYQNNSPCNGNQAKLTLANERKRDIATAWSRFASRDLNRQAENDLKFSSLLLLYTIILILITDHFHGKGVAISSSKIKAD